MDVELLVFVLFFKDQRHIPLNLLFSNFFDPLAFGTPPFWCSGGTYVLVKYFFFQPSKFTTMISCERKPQKTDGMLLRSVTETGTNAGKKRSAWA